MSRTPTSAGRRGWGVISRSHSPMQHGPSRVVCWPVAFVICPMRLSCVPAARGTWGEESCGCGYSRITVVSRDCQENRADDCLENTGGCDAATRSEEHTSELQSLMRISYAVFCLKTKNNK